MSHPIPPNTPIYHHHSAQALSSSRHEAERAEHGLRGKEGELAALFETDDFEAAAQKLSAIVETAAITRGAAGSVILRAEERATVAAFPVDKVVDTTGAGDQYAAGVLLGLARGLPLDQAGALGSLAASEVIAHWGPRPMTPLKDLAAQHGLTIG